MAADPRLANLPALRKLAEEEARVRQEALAAGWPSMDPCPPPTWVAMSQAEREYLIAVEFALLSDLTRWQSQRAVERLVTVAVDLPLDRGAPHLGRYVCGEHCADGDTGRMEACSRAVWSLMVDGLDPVLFADCTDEDGDGRRHVAGISAVTDPAEALTLISLHVLGSPDADR